MPNTETIGLHPPEDNGEGLDGEPGKGKIGGKPTEEVPTHDHHKEVEHEGGKVDKGYVAEDGGTQHILLSPFFIKSIFEIIYQSLQMPFESSRVLVGSSCYTYSDSIPFS